jgi:hypothetical protein
MLEKDASKLGDRDLVCIDARLKVPVLSACVRHCCDEVRWIVEVSKRFTSRSLSAKACAEARRGKMAVRSRQCEQVACRVSKSKQGK